MNYEKIISEEFWDEIFKWRAPCGRYGKIIFYMGHMTSDLRVRTVSEDITLLDDYIQSSRTSSRHFGPAEIALRVLDAAYIFGEQNALDFLNWGQTVDRLFSETELVSGNYSDFQSAAAVSLALSTVKNDMYWSWLSRRSRQPTPNSEWRCQTHQPGPVNPGPLLQVAWAHAPKSRLKSWPQLPILFLRATQHSAHRWSSKCRAFPSDL